MSTAPAMNPRWLQLVAVASVLLELVLRASGTADQLLAFLTVTNSLLTCWLVTKGREFTPADENLPAVGAVLLAGGLLLLGVSGASYLSGRLGGAAVLPVVVVAGCCTAGGLAWLSLQGTGA